MTSKQSIPHRPFGIVKTVLDTLGYQITHCYEDLVFIEHNAFLLRMEEKGEDISLFFNTESQEEKRSEIANLLQNEGLLAGLYITGKGTYTMTPNEENETIDITFEE